LNSSLVKARNTAEKNKITFQMALIDMVAGAKDISEEEKERLISRAIQTLPGFLTRPPEARTPKDAKKLAREIIEGRNPLTSEGLVFRTPHGTFKYKTVNEHDVVIADILPGEGRLKGKAAGAIAYSLVPGGPIVGKIGTGLSARFREELWRNRDKYIGRVARIKAQGQFRTGAYRAPVFISLHEDYPTKAGDRMTWGSEIDARLAKT